MLRRATRILKWSALSLTILFAAAFALNFRTDFAYASRPVAVAVSHFHLIVMTRDSADLAMQHTKLGWSFAPGRYINNPGLQHWKTISPWGTGTAVPLWMPLAAFGFVTITLFTGDAIVAFRRRAGHCPCGYDLRGLIPGAPCPECGASTR